MIKGPYLAKQDTTFEVDTEWECVKVYLIRRSHFAIPGRDSDPWTKASQLFADKSQDAGETIKANKLRSQQQQTMSEWLELPSPVTQPSQLLQSSPRATKLVFPDHNIRWDSQISVSIVSRPWALRNCQNPWDSRVIRETWQVWFIIIK